MMCKLMLILYKSFCSAANFNLVNYQCSYLDLETLLSLPASYVYIQLMLDPGIKICQWADNFWVLKVGQVWVRKWNERKQQGNIPFIFYWKVLL